MKKLPIQQYTNLTGSLVFFLIFSVNQTYAVANHPSISPEVSSSASPSGTQNSDLMNKIDQQINNLKSRIASRVAQLNLVEKRGIIGTISEISGTQIKLLDTYNTIRFVDVDELTKFSSPSAKGTFGISDLTKGTLVGVLGNYNKDSKRILARFVDGVSFPKTISGYVHSIDKKNYQFTVTTLDKETPLIDVENITKSYIYTANDGQKKAGFSKITTDERVYAIGFPDKTNPNMIIASRIILFPELSQNISASPTISETPTPKQK